MAASPITTNQIPMLDEPPDAAGVRRLTLNRPQARNALSVAMMKALLAALEAAGRDPQTRVIVKPQGEGANALALAWIERRDRHHHARWTKGPCAGSISPTTA